MAKVEWTDLGRDLQDLSFHNKPKDSKTSWGWEGGEGSEINVDKVFNHT